jgi:hypothetical protein
MERTHDEGYHQNSDHRRCVRLVRGNDADADCRGIPADMGVMMQNGDELSWMMARRVAQMQLSTVIHSSRSLQRRLE